MSRTNSQMEQRTANSGFLAGPVQPDSDKLLLTGNPIVYDQRTLLWEFEGRKYYEVIQGGALTGADMSDVVFNCEHTGRVYARTKNGSLQLRETGQGAESSIELDANDQGHREVFNDVKSGRYDRMSFAFQIAEEEFDEASSTFTIKRIKKVFDVSAVAFPAYDAAVISARCAALTGENRKRQTGENRSREREAIIALTYL